jgi:CheY-like chemotaxis protein
MCSIRPDTLIKIANKRPIEFETMKHVLLVDDDAVTLKLYETALTRLGFKVTSAVDGIRASQALISAKPDVVVLDLMMPNFNGVDVLKFIRTNGNLKELPVIVLTNAYLTDIAEKAIALGVQDASLKVRCSPPQLAKTINRIFEEGPTLVKSPHAAATAPATPPSVPPASTSPPAEATPVASPKPATVEPRSSEQVHDSVRTGLLNNAPKIRQELHSLHQEFVRAQLDTERSVRLQNLYRRVHFLTATAGMAGCHRIALLSSAFEALLFELTNQPALLTPSIRITVAMANDFLGQLLERANEVETPNVATPRALIVDDDPLSNRLISAALRYDHLDVRTTEDPLEALRWAGEKKFDLFLLDIEMPGMDGFELCMQLRVMPEYQRVPVIFVTSHADFDHRAKSVLSGSNDLISKPVFPIELAVKAIIHLIRGGMKPVNKP